MSKNVVVSSSDPGSSVMNSQVDYLIRIRTELSNLPPRAINRLLADNWAECAYPGKLSHTNMIYGAISEMKFPLGTSVCNAVTADKLMKIANETKESIKIQSQIEEIVIRVKALCPEGKSPTLLLPCSDKSHCGLVIASDGKVSWGDSLGYKPFGSRSKIVDIVHKIMSRCFRSSDWVIQMNSDDVYKNYMIDVLGYVPQKDTYSCGMYVISTLCHFAESVGEIHAYPYKVYDQEVTEMYRLSAVRAYIKSANEVAVSNPRLSPVDVHVHIMERIKFYPSNYPADKKRIVVYRDKSIKKYGVVVENIDEYISMLRRHNLEYFNRRRGYNPAMKDFNNRIMYTCFRERKGCKATLTARYYPLEKKYRITKSHVHSHGLEKPEPVIQRKSKN